MIESIFNTVVTMISVYSFVCIARILMTWVPGSEQSTLGHYIAAFTDPYLNWFQRFKFTRIGNLDFSAVFALAVLSVGSMTFGTLAATGKISLGYILASLVQVLWSFVGFFLSLILVMLAIRLIYDLVNRHSYSDFWTMLDRFLNRPISWVTNLFSHNKPLTYRASLILTFIVILALRIGLSVAIWHLVNLLHYLPI